jgi:hypothetical protein
LDIEEKPEKGRYGGLRNGGPRMRTCWLISNIPMSFLSLVNRTKAFSTWLVSVFWSTIRKFRCESGGSETCPTPASSRPVTELLTGQTTSSEVISPSLDASGRAKTEAYSSSPITARYCRSWHPSVSKLASWNTWAANLVGRRGSSHED